MPELVRIRIFSVIINAPLRAFFVLRGKPLQATNKFATFTGLAMKTGRKNEMLKIPSNVTETVLNFQGGFVGYWGLLVLKIGLIGVRLEKGK